MDMRDQYADYLAYLRTMAANGNNLFYSFSKNLGGEMSSLAAYYLNNPINYLIYLFPLQDLPKAITLLIVLRIGLCGLTSNLFFRNTGKADFSTTIFFNVICHDGILHGKCGKCFFYRWCNLSSTGCIGDREDY